jgi:hypothetical protein
MSLFSYLMNSEYPIGLLHAVRQLCSAVWQVTVQDPPECDDSTADARTGHSRNSCATNEGTSWLVRFTKYCYGDQMKEDEVGGHEHGWGRREMHTKFCLEKNLKGRDYSEDLCFNWALRHEGVLGEWKYSSIHSLTSALDGCEWSASRPYRFTSGERVPGTHWIGWVCPRTSLDAVARRGSPSLC